MKWTRGWLKGVEQGKFSRKSSRKHKVPKKICGYVDMQFSQNEGKLLTI
jgi:hypothetical protein